MISRWLVGFKTLVLIGSNWQLLGFKTLVLIGSNWQLLEFKTLVLIGSNWQLLGFQALVLIGSELTIFFVFTLENISSAVPKSWCLFGLRMLLRFEAKVTLLFKHTTMLRQINFTSDTRKKFTKSHRLCRLLNYWKLFCLFGFWNVQGRNGFQWKNAPSSWLFITQEFISKNVSKNYKASSSFWDFFFLPSSGRSAGSVAFFLMNSTKSETSRPPWYFSGLSLLFLGAQ